MHCRYEKSETNVQYPVSAIVSCLYFCLYWFNALNFSNDNIILFFNNKENYYETIYFFFNLPIKHVRELYFQYYSPLLPTGINFTPFYFHHLRTSYLLCIYILHITQYTHPRNI